MNAKEIGAKLVELCKTGQNMQAIETLYSPDVVSVEAAGMPNMPAEQKGLQAVLAKNKWWGENHEVHSASCEGPYPNGDRFTVRFKYDITQKQSKQRFEMDEVALYTVANGKIVREEFFYQTP